MRKFHLAVGWRSTTGRGPRRSFVEDRVCVDRCCRRCVDAREPRSPRRETVGVHATDGFTFALKVKRGLARKLPRAKLEHDAPVHPYTEVPVPITACNCPSVGKDQCRENVNGGSDP